MSTFKYADIVKTIDPVYFPKYPDSRHPFHASVVDDYISRAKVVSLKEPTIVFMAGCYGSGKSHTITRLEHKSVPPIDQCVYVDPDAIRMKIPELKSYIEKDPWTAGDKTHMEAGYLSEIVQRKLMELRCNIIVDGSLHDGKWYGETYIPWIRKTHPCYRIVVIYVKADWQNVLERCWKRCEETKRCIPLSKLRYIYHRVPHSIDFLRERVDTVIEVENNSNSSSINKLNELVNRCAKVDLKTIM